MKYVLDSSVAFKWAVVEVDTVKALRLRADYQHAIHELLAPDIFPVEVAHAMTRAERQGRVSRMDGWKFWRDIMADSPHLQPYLQLMPRAYEISSTLRVGVYDCLYVALAEQEGCEFVTADDKLVARLQPLFPFIVPLASFP
jgi:predicted nucleic acid-binding protein